jgi:Beta-lactamase enzyme family
MDDRRPPRRGDGGSALPSNRYTPRSGYRPRSESSSRSPSSRGPRDWRDQDWREEDFRAPPTVPRSSSSRRPQSRDASWDSWNDAPQRQSARTGTGYADESSPRSRSARYGNEDTWTPASMRNGYGAQPKKKSSRVWLFAVLGLLLVIIPSAVLVSQWSRIQTLIGLGGDPLFPWAHQTQQTAVNPDYDAFATQQAAIDPAFKAYYDAHGGATLLGTPLTGALPTSGGLAQFFTAGALLLPNAQNSGAGSASGDTAIQIVESVKGSGDVVRLPVPPALLKLGSQLTVGSLSYGDLRTAAQPEKLVNSGTPATPAPDATSDSPVLFAIKNGSGHTIPPVIWAYVNGSTTSPGGMLANFGRPLTEALEATATVDGASHHILVQPFWYGVVIVDNDAKDDKGQPKITVATAGADYLRTLGPPTVALAAKTPAWGNATVPLLDAPATGKTVGTIGPNFPLTLTGQTKWSKTALWYNANFSAAKRSGSGWAPASALTLTAPPKDARPEAGLDMLSPDLAAYVDSQQENMGVAIYDITRNIYYGSNDSATFVLASASKVAIMASYMDWVEGQNRDLRTDEINTLAQMIEVSDNDAAQLLFARMGFGAGQQAYLHKIGIDDYAPCGSGFGCAKQSPATITKLVTLLYQGKILTKEHQQLALTLMNKVVPGMRWGVGDTAPQGATVYMKDGWLNVTSWTDWALNTTGVVVVGNETYAITVLSQHNTSEDWSKLNKVCGDVAKLMTS